MMELLFRLRCFHTPLYPISKKSGNQIFNLIDDIG